jgi:ribose transport system substrate-binding protein
MGYDGIRTLVAHLKGEKVARKIDTGVKLATPANMSDPDVWELLQPDLSRWLNE